MTDQNIKSEFGRGIEVCMDSLNRLTLRISRNSADADDLVAETVTNAWSAFATLEDRNCFRAWHLRI